MTKIYYSLSVKKNCKREIPHAWLYASFKIHNYINKYASVIISTSRTRTVNFHKWLNQWIGLECNLLHQHKMQILELHFFLFCTLKLHTRHSHRWFIKSKCICATLSECIRSCRWTIIVITSTSLSRFNRAVYRSGDVGTIVRLSTFQMEDVEEINTSIPRRRVWGARQTQKLVFRKLVSVINNELSIYFTREPLTTRRSSVYSGVHRDRERGILSRLY